MQYVFTEIHVHVYRDFCLQYVSSMLLYNKNNL